MIAQGATKMIRLHIVMCMHTTFRCQRKGQGNLKSHLDQIIQFVDADNIKN